MATEKARVAIRRKWAFIGFKNEGRGVRVKPMVPTVGDAWLRKLLIRVER